MSGIGGQIFPWCRKSHPDSADGAVEISLTSPSTQRQMPCGSLCTPRDNTRSTVDGGSVGLNYNFPFSKQVPPTPRHSHNDPHVEVQPVRGHNLPSCAFNVYARMRGNAGHKNFTAENYTVVGCTTPVCFSETGRRIRPREPAQVDFPIAEGRTTAETWQSAHPTGNNFHKEDVHKSTSPPQSGTLPSLSYGWWALQPKWWRIPFPSDELRKMLMRSQRVSSTEGTVRGRGAAKNNFQSDIKEESFPPGATPQEKVPSVAKALLHERIERDLERLLRELLHSPTGRLDLQCALHATVERGFLRGASCSSTDAAVATADDPLLKGFWSVPCSGGHAEPLANEVPSFHQQLWRQHARQSHHTREALPHEGESQSAHVRAHNRREVVHLCRMLGSKGELVHVPYTPYHPQNISRVSGPLAKGT